MSVPQTPQAATLINTSPGPTSGTGTSSTRTTPLSRYTPARMVLGTGPRARTASRIVLVMLIAPRPLLPLQCPIAEIVVGLPGYICRENPQDFAPISHFSSQT